MTVRSLKKCCNINAMNGTKCDVIFEVDGDDDDDELDTNDSFHSSERVA